MKLIVFYLEKTIASIFLLKYMLEQEGLKVRTGLKCSEECILNGLIKKYKYQVISEHKGEEAGIKSSTLKVQGDYLYGLMKMSPVSTD